MTTKECKCVTKWKEEVEKRLNAECVSSDIPYRSEGLSYRKIVTPKDPYYGDNKPRISKYWFCAESKDFKFCPHCGKKLEED